MILSNDGGSDDDPLWCMEQKLERFNHNWIQSIFIQYYIDFDLWVSIKQTPKMMTFLNFDHIWLSNIFIEISRYSMHICILSNTVTRLHIMNHTNEWPKKTQHADHNTLSDKITKCSFDLGSHHTQHTHTPQFMLNYISTYAHEILSFYYYCCDFNYNINFQCGDDCESLICILVFATHLDAYIAIFSGLCSRPFFFVKKIKVVYEDTCAL